MRAAAILLPALVIFASLTLMIEAITLTRVALTALDQIVGDKGDIDFQVIAHNPLKLSMAVPRLLEVPVRFRSEDLGLADASCVTLEETVVSTRERAAEKIGCKPSWDEILAHPAEVDQVLSLTEVGIASAWVKSFGGPPGTGLVVLPPDVREQRLEEIRRVAEYGITRR